MVLFSTPDCRRFRCSGNVGGGDVAKEPWSESGNEVLHAPPRLRQGVLRYGVSAGFHPLLRGDLECRWESAFFDAVDPFLEFASSLAFGLARYRLAGAPRAFMNHVAREPEPIGIYGAFATLVDHFWPSFFLGGRPPFFPVFPAYQFVSVKAQGR